MINNLENEIWKDIPDFDGKYQLSNKGRIKSFYFDEEGTLLKTTIDRNGYIKIRLKNKEYYVHRLVALLFVPNPYFYKEINHKDGNKENNCCENLEWCTRSENVKHAFANGLKENRKGSESNAAKSFYQFDKQGNLIRRWGSLVECAGYLEKLDAKNGPAKDIRKRLTATLHNRHKSCCGFLFSFEDSVDAESKLSKARISVLAFPVKGHKGAYEISGEPIRFRTIQETEGYVMPNGKKAIATIVVKCCKGKRDTHAGYKWTYNKEVKCDEYHRK